MFEKEAEKYASDLELIYKKGVLDGYNKAKEELEKEKCELLGIIQGKDKVIQELKKETEEKARELEDIFMSYLEKIPEDLKLGEEREVTCVCGGKLFIGKSKLNGHIRMACNKCKFQIMQ